MCKRKNVPPYSVDVLFLNLHHWDLLFYWFIHVVPELTWKTLGMEDSYGDGAVVPAGPLTPISPHFPLFLVLYQRDLLALPPNTTISAVTPLSFFLENKNINKDRGLGRGWMIFQNIYQTWPAPQTKPRARQTRAAEPGFPGFGWRTCLIYQQLSHFLNCELQN